MEVRYGCNPRDFKKYNTKEIRDEFLVEKIFEEDKILLNYSHIDRIIFGGAMPKNTDLILDEAIDVKKELGMNYFLESRELGIINIGAKGRIIVDDEEYELDNLNALYIGKGHQKIVFKNIDGAKFYLASAPAHEEKKTVLINMNNAKKVPCGDSSTSNKRVINQLIHSSIVDTCQLMMGCTELKDGSVWNTMPAHTHERRMEVYFYFDIDSDNVVMHFMGEPEETRHVVMKNEQAIISPSWSIHSGCGTSSYKFIWAMVGENKVFEDMDDLKITDLK